MRSVTDPGMPWRSGAAAIFLPDKTVQGDFIPEREEPLVFLGQGKSPFLTGFAGADPEHQSSLSSGPGVPQQHEELSTIVTFSSFRDERHRSFISVATSTVCVRPKAGFKAYLTIQDMGGGSHCCPQVSVCGVGLCLNSVSP